MSITVSPDETKNPSGARPTIPEGGTVPRPVTIDLGLRTRDGKLGQPVTPQPKPIPEMEKQQMNAYAQGFVQKCAEAGVDPQQLVKVALIGSAGIKDELRDKWRQHGWGSQGSPETLAAFTAGRRARTEPTRMGAQLAANPLATLSTGGLLPLLYGSGRPGSDTSGIGAIKGLGGAIGGIPLGAVGGGTVGAGAGAGIGGLLALVALLKGKLPPGELAALLQRGAVSGGTSGAVLGGALGPGELTYQLLKSKGE